MYVDVVLGKQNHLNCLDFYIQHICSLYLKEVYSFSKKLPSFVPLNHIQRFYVLCKMVTTR